MYSALKRSAFWATGINPCSELQNTLRNPYRTPMNLEKATVLALISTPRNFDLFKAVSQQIEFNKEQTTKS